MAKIFIIIFLFSLEVYCQTYPISKDVSVYQGDYTVLSFTIRGNVSSDSLVFGVKADRDDDTPRVIQKENTAAGGGDSEIQVIYSSPTSTILVKLLTDDTEGIASAVYVYDLTRDSTTIYTGYFTNRDDVTGGADGVATRTPYYTIGIDTTTDEPGIPAFYNSDNSMVYLTYDELGDSIGVADSIDVAADLDSLYEKTDSLQRDVDSLYGELIESSDEFSMLIGNSDGWVVAGKEAIQDSLEITRSPFVAFADTIDFTEGMNYELTLSGNTTIYFKNVVEGKAIFVKINNPSTYTVTWADTLIQWIDNATPTMSTTAYDIYGFLYDGTDITGFYKQNFSLSLYNRIYDLDSNSTFEEGATFWADVGDVNFQFLPRILYRGLIRGSWQTPITFQTLTRKSYWYLKEIV